VIDLVEQGTPPSPPACVTYAGAPVDLATLQPWSAAVRLHHAGFRADAFASDWVVANTTKP
jgi:hypothetical protein